MNPRYLLLYRTVPDARRSEASIKPENSLYNALIKWPLTTCPNQVGCLNSFS